MRLSELGLRTIGDAEFDDLALLNRQTWRKLSYITTGRFVPMAKGPVVTTSDLAPLMNGYAVALSDDPETDFWNIHERLIRAQFYGHPGSSVGKDSHVHPTAVIGKDGFEHHRNRPIQHAGYVLIGERVTIGAHSCVDRSLFKEPTSIGDDTHIDNLVHVAHNVQIGKRCRIVAGTVIGGSAIIGDDVFVGIGARIRPGVRIGDGAFIGMSVTVLRDVAAGERIVVK